MVALWRILNHVVAALALAVLLSRPVSAQTDRLEGLFQQLRQPDLPNWEMVEQEIWAEWSKSGSPAMDLLLQRGREAMEKEDYRTAVDHFTALIDHAPDFAEGYNARATAYFREGLLGPALGDIRMALALNPRHFGAMIGLGTIMEEIGNPEQALKAYHAAQAIHPHEPDLRDAVERLEQQLSGVAL